MAITLRQLQIFARIANRQSVTQASEDLQLTQSAVSMALAELERYSDGPLFHRERKKLLLNDRGREILPLVKNLLKQANQIEILLNESARQPAGELIVGASTTIGNYLMPQLITQFSTYYPKAKVLLQVGNAQQIENGIDCGAIDLGLSEGFRHISRLNQNTWRDDELVIIVGPHHPWALKTKLTKAEFQNGDWIMREKGSGTREVFERAVRRQNMSVNIIMELGHTEAIKKAVEAGAGCACLSRIAVQRELQQGWLVEIKGPVKLTRELIILAREDSYHSVLFDTFMHYLQSGKPFLTS